MKKQNNTTKRNALKHIYKMDFPFYRNESADLHVI